MTTLARARAETFKAAINHYFDFMKAVDDIGFAQPITERGFIVTLIMTLSDAERHGLLQPGASKEILGFLVPPMPVKQKRWSRRRQVNPYPTDFD